MSKYKTDPEVRAKIDDILRANATLQANLGTEHEKNSPERKHAKAQWREWLKDIRALDPEFARTVQEQE